jgi:hypothetical protein
MRWLDKNGKIVNVSVNKYLIDWDKNAPSKECQVVKDFLREYFSRDVILEEFRIPKTRLRVDYINLSKRFAWEHNGRQHDKFNSFMHGSKIGFIRSIKRDDEKMKNLILNGFDYIISEKSDFPLDLDFLRRNNVNI